MAPAWVVISSSGRLRRAGPGVRGQAVVCVYMLSVTFLLDWLPYPHPVLPVSRSTIGTTKDADAILCRTNAEAMRQVRGAYEAGLRPMLLKGFGEILAMTSAARDLKQGRSAEHPDLSGFVAWGDVQAYAEQEADGGDLKTFVKLIDSYDCDAIIHVASLYRDVEDPDVSIYTIHRAMGGEWPTV
jgi:hypothetical protein